MRRHGRSIAFLAAAAAMLLAHSIRPVSAQPLSEDVYKGGDRIRAAFRPVIADARTSTVRVFVDGDRAALGIVVSPQGFVLTKATQLHGELSIKTADGREFDAKRIAVDSSSDLALLKVDAQDLVPAEWADEEPVVGSWLVSSAEGRSPVGVGVVSVAGRQISAQKGVLGIILGESVDARVMRVLPGSCAEEAGLLEGDVITTVAGQTIETRDALLRQLAHFSPGDTLALSVRRGEKTEEVNAILGSEATTVFDRHDRQVRQNMMGGPLSIRSGGFARAFQHDTALKPEDCGGPVVDLSGRIVGINIARAGRIESYALPTATVRPILAKLMSADSTTAKK